MTDLPADFFDRPLAEVDPEVADALDCELARQQRTLEMIASENFVPQAVLECQGSVLTNKYAEGYPGRRYYGGCEHVDVVEQLAIDRAKALFGAEHANVQPHAGAQANTAVYHALLQPGDTILGLALPHGGHLTHGMKINVSGRLYDIAPYEVSRRTTGSTWTRSSASRRSAGRSCSSPAGRPTRGILDFPRFREIADEVGAILMVDMAHFAGLVAAGLHPSPVPYADVVTTTIHKTLGGARGGHDPVPRGVREEDRLRGVPGQQGGPLEHVIAGKAVALRIAAAEAFRERQQRTVAGAKAVAEELLGAGHGVNVLTGGTDVHLVLVDLRESELDGQQAEDRLHDIGITVNRNAVPFDPRPPMVTSGLRVGHPGAGHARAAGRRLRGGRQHHGPRAHARLRRPQRRARRARHGDRRPLPALRAVGRSGRGVWGRGGRGAAPGRTVRCGSPATRGSSARASSAAAGRSSGAGASAAITASASAGGTRRPSGVGRPHELREALGRVADSRAPGRRGNGRRR